MPSMLSADMVSRKQLLSWLRGVPELKSVGDACVNQPSDMRSYVCIHTSDNETLMISRRTSMAASMLLEWMPMATRMNMCWGRSCTTPFSFSRYERSSVYTCVMPSASHKKTRQTLKPKYWKLKSRS